LSSVQKIADDAGEGKTKIQQYIKINDLIPELLEMVDGNEIKFNPAYELAFLRPEEQAVLYDILQAEEVTPSLSQAQRLKRASQEGRLSEQDIAAIMREEKAQPQTNALLEQAMSANEEAAKELRLPAQTLPTDVLTFMYKEKNGKTRIRTSLFADYVLIETQVFFENGMLCISDFQDVYGIPVSEIVRIEQGKKRIMATGWNKMQEPTDKCFKQYRLSVNAYGTVFMKPYIMTIKHGDEEFELFIPPYEMEKICFLCGLPFPVAADKNAR